MRALRIDKFTAASLDRTISLYLKEDIRQEIPVYEMMSRSAAQLKTMVQELVTEIASFSGEHISETNSWLNSWEKPLPGQPQKRGFQSRREQQIPIRNCSQQPTSQAAAPRRGKLCLDLPWE